MTAIQKFLKRHVKNCCVLHDLQGFLQKEKRILCWQQQKLIKAVDLCKYIFSNANYELKICT